MLTKLNATNTVDIPQEVRDALRLEPGVLLEIEVMQDGVMLRPVKPTPREKLRGKYASYSEKGSVLEELEAEHAAEVAKDRRS